MGEERKVYKVFWWERLKEGDKLEDQGVAGKIELEWILGRLASRVWIGFN
jgi:hypothetical protein